MADFYLVPQGTVYVLIEKAGKPGKEAFRQTNQYRVWYHKFEADLKMQSANMYKCTCIIVKPRLHIGGSAFRHAPRETC